MNNLTIYTAAGGMQICYLKDLPDKIAMQKVSNTLVVVPEIKTQNYGQWFYQNDKEILIPEQQITQSEYKLTQFYEVNELDQFHRERFGRYIEDRPEYLAQKSTIIQEFKTMLAKKTPFAFIKDLDLKKIDELSSEYAIKFGHDDFIGVEANLSPYQKFFSIIRLDDLRFYMAECKSMDRCSTVYMEKLINANPNNWICYRYENLEYLKELNQLKYFETKDNK